MEHRLSSPAGATAFDVIHFEAHGSEAQHLHEATVRALQQQQLPADLRWLITPQTLQDALAHEPSLFLPAIITTKTHSLLPDDYLDGRRKSIVTRSAGYDHFEQFIARANIASLREYCVQAVAQTAVKFVYAAAGRLNDYTRNTQTFDRDHCPPFMELGRGRVATVFGVGLIGKAIVDLLVANGLTVWGVDLRQQELSRRYQGAVHFVSPPEALAGSDILVNAMNLTRDRVSPMYNVGYFSRDFLSQAAKELIFINVTRGEIAPEEGLLALYDAGKIIGLGLDVFANEAACARALRDGLDPDGATAAARELIRRSIERSANIYVQPHQGFNSDLAVTAKADEAIKHVIAWYRNGGRGFDEQLPYY